MTRLKQVRCTAPSPWLSDCLALTVVSQNPGQLLEQFRFAAAANDPNLISRTITAVRVGRCYVPARQHIRTLSAVLRANPIQNNQPLGLTTTMVDTVNNPNMAPQAPQAPQAPLPAQPPLAPNSISGSSNSFSGSSGMCTSCRCHHLSGLCGAPELV